MAQEYNHKRHREIQVKHWRDFRNQLERLKDKERGLAIRYEEIAEGLDVSRQRLSQYINKPEMGLPIDRANILELWDYLVDPEALDQKNLSKEARRRRETLRVDEAGILDNLLRAAGFLPVSQTIDKTAPQVERVKRRLASPWISDSSVLSKITDNIIDTILDQGGLEKNNRKTTVEYGYSATEAKLWPSKNINSQDVDLRAIENFEREITRFENLGKVKFYDNELFELYQSIAENHLLKNFDVVVRITDCQFKTLTFPLIEEFEKFEINDIRIKDRLSKIFNKCEQNLRSPGPLIDELTDPGNEFLNFPPVIEASVVLNFNDKIKRKSGIEKSRNITFKYSSSATHVENMLLALSNGMGYLLSGTLEITGLFLRAIGKNSDSLARVSVSLSEVAQPKNIYQGLWVEGNIIVGFLQAFLFASLNWLSEKINSTSIPGFFKICEDMSRINQNLDKCLQRVYNYSYTYSCLTDNETMEELQNVEQEIAKQAEYIEDLVKSSQFQSLLSNKAIKEYYETYQENLAMKKFFAILARTHASIVKSDVENATARLRELRSSLYMGGMQISNENFTPIFVLHNSELMFYKLICGDSDFIEDKEWRNPVLDLSIDNSVQKIRDYIISKNSGHIDADIYLAMTQLYGITGLVEFYVCQKEDIEYLEGAIDKFLSAAYYSAKIGHNQRTVRALCHASRTCCRLGYREMAESIVVVVKDLIDKSSKSQFSLAEGELLLRFGNSEVDLYKALFQFLCAWQNSTDHYSSNINLENRRFFRSNIDSLYDIYKLFIRLENMDLSKNYKPFERIQQLLRTEEDRKSFDNKDNPPEKLLEDFLKEYSFDSDASCTQVASKIKEETIRGWNSCCRDDLKKHRFSSWIEDGKFLEDYGSN